MIFTTPDTRIVCAPHHYDWDGVDWEAQWGAERSLQRSMYRDMPLVPLTGGRELLLVESAIAGGSRVPIKRSGGFLCLFTLKTIYTIKYFLYWKNP